VGESSSPRGHDHDAHFLSTSAEDVGRGEKRAGALVERVGAQKTRPGSRVAQHPGGSEGMSTVDKEMTSVVALAVEKSGNIKKCRNRNGKTKNRPVECKCGQDVCTQEGGLFCDTSRDPGRRCKRNPTCTNKTGTTETTVNCHCGDRGEKCEVINVNGEPHTDPKKFCNENNEVKKRCYKENCPPNAPWTKFGTECRCGNEKSKEDWCEVGETCEINEQNGPLNGRGNCVTKP